MRQIPIVMTTDSHYVFQTGIAISTMLQNKKEDVEYLFYILNNGQLSVGDKATIDGINAYYSEEKVHYIEIDEKKIEAQSGCGYVPLASYYRLLIPSVLNEWDKCIFIDGDVIVLDDLQPAYDVEVTDFYLAAVLDCGVQHFDERYERYLQQNDIIERKYYFNAGFLVMNLKSMREECLEDRLLKCIGNNYQMMDQDVLNKCCAGKVKYLPLKFNFFSAYYKNSILLKKGEFSQKELDDAEKEPVIIHYATGGKPWVNVAYDKNGLWWNQAIKFKDYRQFDELWEASQKKYISGKWNILLERCRNKDEIIVFGSSDIGHRVVDWLINCGFSNICAICDNDEKKQGELYRNIPTRSINEVLVKNTGSFEIIVTSQRYFKDIVNQLHDLQVKDKDIFVYSNKSWHYYYKIDYTYLGEEVEEIFLKRYGTMENRESVIQNWIEKVQKNREAFQELYKDLFGYQV